VLLYFYKKISKLFFLFDYYYYICLSIKINTKMKYYGIASANGIESFLPVLYRGESEGFSADPRELSLMALTVNANRQRHSVLYMVDVNREDANEIEELISQGDAADALTLLKERAKTINIMQSPGAEKSWKLIPNTDLDPFNGK
jgi:hypothetical protein